MRVCVTGSSAAAKAPVRRHPPSLVPSASAPCRADARRGEAQATTGQSETGTDGGKAGGQSGSGTAGEMGIDPRRRRARQLRVGEVTVDELAEAGVPPEACAALTAWLGGPVGA